jgi:hypothetical protein
MSELINGPSEAAVAEAADLLDRSGLTHPQTGPSSSTVVRELLHKAHAAEPGLDRSVCLNDVLTLLRERPTARNLAELNESPADYLERVLGGGS